MSRTIDEKVVEMRFDNKHFETNVKTSMSTLETLKQKLKLGDASKGLENIGTAAKNVNMSGLSNAVETIRVRFSALEVMAVTALANITNSAINAGKQIISALTIEPISDGFKEYEMVLNAVQTTMAGTGKTAAEVEKQLKRLDQYADDTIYSTSDMLSNLPKFTNAGVELGKSVTAMIGIANATALAGGDANKASIAFYNLGQAIGTGYLTRMDYNSINNAGIATMEWKNQMIAAAIAQGTLAQTGEDAYKIGNKTYTLQSLFIDGLQEQWATTDVLISVFEDYGDITTEIGAKAQASAQDIKTYTMMMESLQATAGTGWKDTWQLIFGDLDEAKVLWTNLSKVIGGFIDRSANARNEMLQFWKDNGGREALIQSFSNAFKILGSVVKPIKDAFTEFFPPMTGQRLLDITKSIETLTSKFKMNDSTTKNLKSTFRGLFAFLDIGKMALSAIANAAIGFGKAILPMGGGLLGITGTLGEWIVKLRDAIKTGDMFNQAFAKIGNFLQPITNGLVSGLNIIKNAFADFSSVDTSGLTSFSEKVKVRLEPVGKIIEKIGGFFGGLINVFRKVLPVLQGIGSAIGTALNSIVNKIKEAFGEGNFSPIFDLVNGGMLLGIGVGIAKFINSLTSITKDAGGFVSSINALLGGVGDALNAFTGSIKANTLLKIAGAITILAAALVVLSLIDQNKLAGALTAISALFVELFASMAIFEKVMGSKGFASMGKVATAMIGLSAAVLILSFAMKNLAELDWSGIAKGLVSIGAIMAMLVVASKVLSSNSGKLMKGATSLVIFAAAMLLLTESVEALSKLSVEALVKGLVAVGVLMAELVAFTKLASKMSVGSAVGILLLSTAILILAQSVKTFAEIDVNGLIQGLAAMGVLLLELAIFTKISGGAQNMISIGVGMVLLGAAMMIFAEAIARMGAMSWETIGAGLLTLAGALTLITIATNLMPKNMISIGIGLIAIATALLILSQALSIMGGMTWEQIASGLITLAASLTIITVAIQFMTSALPGAAALLIISAALLVLTGALFLLGSMPISTIVQGLLTLAGMFVVLGIAGYVLAPVAIALLAVGAAMLLFGAGVLAAGAGLVLFSVALGMFSEIGMAGIAALAALGVAIVPLAALAPLFLAVGAAMLVFGAAVVILAAGLLVLSAAFTALAVSTPMGITALDQLVQKIAELSPAAGEIAIVGAALIAFGAGAAVAAVGVLALGVGMSILAIGLMLLAAAGQSGIDALVALSEAASEIAWNAVALGSAGVALGAFGAGAALAGAGALAASVGVLGLVAGLTTVLTLSSVIEASMATFITSFQNLVTKGNNILVTAIPQFRLSANNLMSHGFIAGLNDRQPLTLYAVNAIMVNCIAKINSSRNLWSNAGANCGQGLVDGIISKVSAASSAGQMLAQAALNAAKSALGVQSPSKEFIKIGMFTVMGFADGLDQYSVLGENAAKNMASASMKAVQDTISKIQETLDSDMDINPVITPVLDLSNIRNKNAMLGNSLGTITVAESVRKAASIGSDVQTDRASIASSQNDPTSNGLQIQFNQVNNSPKALSRFEIYRQTANQLSTVKRMVTAK